MDHFTIDLAGIAIEICHQYPYTKRICRDYIVADRSPAFRAAVSPENLKAAIERNTEGYSDGCIESLCIFREILFKLIPYGVWIVHSAVVAVEGKAYVFAAHSGVGKSTHIRMWTEVFQERAVVVNGDKPLFRFVTDDNGDEVLHVFGSPWRGKEGMGENISMPVAGICLLERSTENEIHPAAKEEITRRFLDQVMIPAERQAQIQAMSLFDRMIHKVPFYQLRCNISHEAAIVAYNGMQHK